ncbi:MAG: zinc-ribbon domain-containing protein [Thermodesulfobacteriota bacterium]|nr:zinc-ribbon domain-containing protein [Thermodesulfobacteriota bacterium]
MFIAWGSKWEYKVKKNGLRVEKMCPECDKRGEFFEVIPTKYFTLFWIKTAPTETKKPLLECPNCHERFYIQQSDYLSAISRLSKLNQKKDNVIHLPHSMEKGIDGFIILCENCNQKLRVPQKDKMLKITCPSCKNTLYFKNGKKV